MKISVNDQELFNLNETQKKVICHEISEDIFQDDMNRRLQWVLMHKYEQCFKRLKEEWEPILAQRVESVPTNHEALAQLIFAQEDYKCRKQRDAEVNPLEV